VAGSMHISDHTWHIYVFMFNIMLFSHLKLLLLCMAGNLLVSEYLQDHLSGDNVKMDTGKIVLLGVEGIGS
jgi:hypothetical protein